MEPPCGPSRDRMELSDRSGRDIMEPTRRPDWDFMESGRVFPAPDGLWMEPAPVHPNQADVFGSDSDVP